MSLSNNYEETPSGGMKALIAILFIVGVVLLAVTVYMQIYGKPSGYSDETGSTADPYNDENIRANIEQTKLATVYVATFQTNSFRTGTGFVIRSDGYIITNHHVISDNIAIWVKINTEDTFYKAVVVDSREDYDLALLRIWREDLPKAVLGNSGGVKQGDNVRVLGYPLGTQAMLSELMNTEEDENIIPGSGETLKENVGIISSYVSQSDRYTLDVSVNPGNSGGPVVSEKDGKVIAVVYAKIMDAEGISFAIPINLVESFFMAATGEVL